ncbi:uncharacterized protein TRUGW13939_08982 [Talaromyces rugulosus]|uniref:Cysteine-rich transmembrane CYSTM domain-containing protein n=1 Tax=Talaromyces rugulosus TaxID=121627 RepID=A0A7H8R6J7_TALRU|nr:uncharacterized protein TRUGW13939_08982 [Talaromyces rugulosus]QKX61826.1 hypothetical protein TRUGW13939_08982 [Talaromyces rugulosus]
MADKYDQPPAYPAPVHQDAGPYYNQAPSPAPYVQSPPPQGGYNNNGYSSPAPPNGYHPPGQPYYGPPPGGYYQQGYPPQQPQQGYYPPQGYYAQDPNRGHGSSAAGGICAGISAALALCCCADMCFFLL